MVRGVPDLPSVTIVFLAFNRREELRTSLGQMLESSDYPSELVDVIVVDNASKDGTADMLREAFPQVGLIARTENIGVSGWNDGFAQARGDYVLALDDDCYLPPDGLRRAMEAAQERDAQLVSFAVASSEDPDYHFTDMYVTGLLTFWGCAVLVRRDALTELVGYDPEIFVWANELEFTMRLFDRGYRHLYLPEVVAIHMKPQLGDHGINLNSYKRNSRHFAYIATKLLRARDVPEVVVALLSHNVRDALRLDPIALRGIPESVIGAAHGLRHRAPVRPEVSRLYRHNFHSFIGPLHFMRSPSTFLKTARWRLLRMVGRVGEADRPPLRGRREEFLSGRRMYYPEHAATLDV